MKSDDTKVNDMEKFIFKKQDEFLKGPSHKGNSKGKSKDFISKS